MQYVINSNIKRVYTKDNTIISHKEKLKYLLFYHFTKIFIITNIPSYNYICQHKVSLKTNNNYNISYIQIRYNLLVKLKKLIIFWRWRYESKYAKFY